MEELRSLLTTYAYNILGSLEDAKDIVQDAFLQFTQMDREKIKNKKAYLIRVVINRSINLKDRQKKVVTGYHGEWLPEPVSTEEADDNVIRTDVLSYSLLVLLEKLNSRQRAVFILKEAFNYEHSEIAAAIDITEAYSRQLLRRAKKELKTHSNINENTLPPGTLGAYLEVIQSGDIQRLEQFFKEDITLISDGGGKATAAVNPIYGKQPVTGFLLGVFNKFYKEAYIKEGIVNHQPALLYYKGNQLVTCQIFSFKNDTIDHLYFMRNPDKLKNL